MEKRSINQNSLTSEIQKVVPEFLESTKNREIQLVSHFDTDGITSASIMVKALSRMDKRFSLKIIKSIDKEFIDKLDKNKITLFVDLASGSLEDIKEAGLEKTYIVDHHEVAQEIPENVSIINPELFDQQKISSSGLAYLFAKEMDENNSDLAKLGILGMIGDCLEKEIGSLNNGILEDSGVNRKRGLLVYPSTRPLNRTLEFTSNPYIPGVSGDTQGTKDLLSEAGLNPESGKYKSLLELTEQEMRNLITSIMLRKPQANEEEMVGDIFLINLYNQQEDARELSAKINACSRSGYSETALLFCMEVPQAKKQVESIYFKYKQELIKSLKYVQDMEKIQGKGYVIINVEDKVKDTMIGTISSILSNSGAYENGTIIASLAHYEDEKGPKIKVSTRNVGNSGRNVREVLTKIANDMGINEVGGHEFAAGCILEKDMEKDFLERLKKDLEIEQVKV